MSSHRWETVGWVTVLKLRIYPLDPQNGDDMRSTVAVNPGVYPVYRKADACWVMTGDLNERPEKISDGLFALHSGDNPAGLGLKFPSRIYGPEELAELLNDPVCRPGDEQRLHFVFPPTNDPRELVRS